MSKKIILFIVEGNSDEYALSPLVSELVDHSLVRFEVMHGDITAFPEGKYKDKNIVQRLELAINQFLNHNHPLKRSDIAKVIFISDMDACFIPNKYIIETEYDHSFRYEDDGLYVKNKEQAIERNEVKSQNLKDILSLQSINNTLIEAYYFSCNLDHALYNKRNLNKRLKEDYADAFSYKYYNQEIEFMSFIFNREIAPIRDYLSSWEFIKKDLNSISRFTNFNVFFLKNEKYLTNKAKNKLYLLNS